MNVSQKQIDRFQQTIWDFYKKNKRDLPWRKTSDPYKILVSEVMLQQTQVSRIILKYQKFIEKFPTIHSLAKADTKSVLRLWQGIGYNRRALYLKRLAEMIVSKYDGDIPYTIEELDKLPGIGRATAAAIIVYVFNKPVVFIETNIRRVFIHFFFQDQKNIDDKDIIPLVEKACDTKNPREWYWALMDSGTYLAKITDNPNIKSKHYSKQSKFEGSQRQLRGQLLKKLLKQDHLTKKQITSMFDSEKVVPAINELVQEGFIKEKNNIYSIK